MMDSIKQEMDRIPALEFVQQVHLAISMIFFFFALVVAIFSFDRVGGLFIEELTSEISLEIIIIYIYGTLILVSPLLLISIVFAMLSWRCAIERDHIRRHSEMITALMMIRRSVDRNKD
jgi:hypothetical protein